MSRQDNPKIEEENDHDDDDEGALLSALGLIKRHVREMTT
jgi:hypothetical protein